MNFFHVIRLIYLRTYSKFVFFVFSKINGLNFPGIAVYGVPLIIKKKGSSISLGKNCVLRSKSYSNLIGINRPCMFSTLTQEAEIIIGDNCGFSGCVIAAFKSIRLGNHVRCGANTLIEMKLVF